jgi:serine/threonine protein kinase
LQDYQLKELLGQGGFGVVHRATSKAYASKGQEVAIKMVNLVINLLD